MKKMSALVMALLVVLALSACAMMSQFAPSASPAPTQTLEDILTPVPEETPTGDATQEPNQPAPQGLGNLPGNLNNGGLILEGEDGTVYVALRNGLYAVRDGKATQLNQDCAHELNLWNGRLYYVAQEYHDTEWDYRELLSESVVSVLADGSDRQVLAEKRPVRRDNFYNAEQELLETSTWYCGYEDLIVADGAIYYIANNANAGSMDVRSSVNGKEGKVSWESDKSIYRMDLDGTHVEEIVANIGAAEPHMCIDGGKIYYSTSYENCFYSYPFVTFRSCNLDGTQDAALLGADYNPNFACGYTSDKGAMTELVSGLLVADGKLYVSATDSEGDFPCSRLMRVDGDGYYEMQEELYYVYTLAREDGSMVWFSAPGQIEWEEDDDGVILMEYFKDAALCFGKPDAEAARAKTLLSFDRLNRWEDEFSWFRIALFDDNLYALTDKALYRIDVTDAEQAVVWTLPEGAKPND